MSGAHEGGIFSVCVLKDGTMVSGGGKDRKVVLWGHDYRKKAEMEVMTCVHQRHHLYLSHGSQEGHQEEDMNRNTSDQYCALHLTFETEMNELVLCSIVSVIFN